jgi:geranylgeranyl pyrophosphate synthase
MCHAWLSSELEGKSECRLLCTHKPYVQQHSTPVSEALLCARVQVIADFANGEISQAGSLFDTEVTLQQYSDKSFYKTASLIAASCRSSAVFSDCSVEVGRRARTVAATAAAVLHGA